jgi:hypothetical protein
VLLDSEIARCKYELGYNIMTIGALPYIGIAALFEAVIQPYVGAGAKTSSATTVAASTSPTPVVLTLVDVTGFHDGDVVIVDVDDRQERVTVEQVSGSTIRVLLSKAHSVSFPVLVEGGEAIIRTLLGHLYDVEQKIVSASKTAGLKSAGRGAVEWYGGASGGTVLSSLKSLQMHWRDQLASALGIANGWRFKGGAGASEIY